VLAETLGLVVARKDDGMSYSRRFAWLVATDGRCCTGIEELLIPLLVPAIGETAAAVAAPALIGAGGGAALSGITGGNPLLGAATGGVTGGVIGAVGPSVFGPEITAATGLGQQGVDAIAGAAAGGLGSVATGQNPLIGAAAGGIAGAIAPTTGVSSGSGAAVPGVEGGGPLPGPGASAATTVVPNGTAGASIGGPATGGTGIGGDYAGGDIGGQITQTSPGTLLSAQGSPTATGNSTSISGSGIANSSTGAAVSDMPSQAASDAALTGAPTVASGGPSAGPTAGLGPDDFSGGSDTGTLGNIGNWIQNNPMPLLAGGMLLPQLFKDQNPAELQQLRGAATNAGTMATALEAPLFSGVLPPGQSAPIEHAGRNQKAVVRSAYAKAGMAGSTSEAEALGAVDANVGAQKTAAAERLFSKAAGYANMQTTDLTNILTQQRNQDTDFNNALARFAAALAGSRSGTRTAST
jgi:hypothetical protein